MTALYIALAGALGSVCRHLVGAGLTRLVGGTLPYGTLAVNVLGSFLIGFLMDLFAARGQLDSALRVALTVGFLGGFTTYSSFALETVQLVQNRQYGAVLLYVGATLITAALACAGGIALARGLR
ncbi:fluoride efflux transporter CrcB [Haliangium sp.]|uniref:fluoride efflux transporter CrcB n=1 Tax=Haliangium sp. TaxID=2663208 RepID=UPI003D0FA7CC